MKYILNIRDTSWGSLYCRATIVVDSGVVVSQSYAGMARVRGDRWYYIVKKYEVGTSVTKEDLQYLVDEFHGKCKVVAKLEKVQ